MRFDVPAAPAADAIAEFARQAHINILASTADLAGIVTNDVRGVLPVSVALAMLLADTPLTTRQSASGAVLVVAAVVEPHRPALA
ncbi:iron complex outermembrane recepter protein [Duganella sp. CF517]|uniref:STN domain-containing protein n=1 Tax=Duganella sp. CF517 TaxID=1881038 RepID=UPI0008B87B94|nr:STN domain-containing protein [Duganella sp. CF517]SEN10087.1 iron complex outermembrane recepter protein [Duganella sp. CF517]